MPRTAAIGSEELARQVAVLCREKRGEEVVALDLRGLVDYTDFLILVTGRSERQNRSIAEHLSRSLKPLGFRALSIAGEEPGTWICLDFVDLVIHLFDPATRAHYDLELLWGDAPRLSV
jgi:ribosome-associated protein